MVGQKLAGRYRLLKQLGQGGFGQAYLAEDEHLPDEYQCVVKRFHMGEAQQEDTLQTAKRLFDSEAKALHRLGHHEQLPKLLAHFEDDGEFYLVEEYIPGPGLDTELQPGVAMPEAEVTQLLHDLLSVLSFVHQKHVIHRDIKPSNIIRRDSDQRLVLIDFGAVKHVTTQMIGGTVRPHTVVIGTPGYMPSEQFRGSPKPSSDVYAVGMIGIQAITGLNPSMGELPEDDTTGEIQWQEHADVSPELADVLNKMVRYDFRQRYRSATEALEALNNLTSPAAASLETEVATTEETPPTEVSIPMPDDVANLPETQVQHLNNGNITPEAPQVPGAIPALLDSKATEELPSTTVQQTTDDPPTTLPKTSEASKSLDPTSSKFGRKSWKWLAGGGLAIAASGLFALVGAPHLEGVCSALGNCTAAVRARSDLASALSTLENSDEKLAKATSIPELESLHTEMKESLETVRSIGSDNSLAIAEEAKTSADDYEQKFDQLTQRIEQEKDSQKNLDSAVARASEAFKEKESAKTIAAMDENISKWQAAVDFLKKIKEPAFVYDQAQTKQKDYEAHIKNLNASIDKIVAEDRARQQQQAAARQAEQQRSAQTPAYDPAPSYASNSGSGSSYQAPAPVYQEPAYQAPAPTYQEPAYQAPAPAPAPPPSNSEPLWGGPSDPQAEPLW